MEKPVFAVRFSSDTFEHYSGMGYRVTGGSPVECQAITKADFGLHLCTAGPVEDESGKVIGWRFKDCESKEYHDVFPGEVHHISVWTTAVDDDGCPEDICIHYYIELIPYDEVFFD